MAREKLIKVDESAIGCTSTRDLKDDKGAIVCCAGDILDWRLVHKLRRDGIDTVYVKHGTARRENQDVDERLSELNRNSRTRGRGRLRSDRNAPYRSDHSAIDILVSNSISAGAAREG